MHELMILALIVVAAVGGGVIGWVVRSWRSPGGSISVTQRGLVDQARRVLRRLRGVARATGPDELVDAARWADLRRELTAVLALIRRKSRGGDPTVPIRKQRHRETV